MTRVQQRRFIRELIRNVERGILLQVPKLPATWDGHELRALVRDRVALVYWQTMRRGRVRAYRNEVRVRNLI